LRGDGMMRGLFVWYSPNWNEYWIQPS
jgi:hypothetical protein